MSNRLDTISKLIPDGRGVADVGTDHGYIPVMLASRGYSGNLVATDINAGPLKSAVESARDAGIENRIQFLQCDGLSKVTPETVDTIVIAGMGGDTITGILDRDYWCAEPGHILILQPMSHQNVLRYWLVHNEFDIVREELVKDSGTIYQVLMAVPGTAPRYSDGELFTGAFERVHEQPLFPEYLDGLIKKFTAAVAGMENAKNISRGQLHLNREVLNDLLCMKERL